MLGCANTFLSSTNTRWWEWQQHLYCSQSNTHTETQQATSDAKKKKRCDGHAHAFSLYHISIWWFTCSGTFSRPCSASNRESSYYDTKALIVSYKIRKKRENPPASSLRDSPKSFVRTPKERLHSPGYSFRKRQRLSKAPANMHTSKGRQTSAVLILTR